MTASRSTAATAIAAPCRRHPAREGRSRLRSGATARRADADLKVTALDPNRPAPQPFLSQPEKPKPPPTVDALGLKIARDTPELRKQVSLPDAAKGIVIVEVPQNGSGATQGLRAGDLIVAAEGSPVAAPDQLLQLIAGAKKGGRKFAFIQVEREGNTRFIALPIGEG